MTGMRGRLLDSVPVQRDTTAGPGGAEPGDVKRCDDKTHAEPALGGLVDLVQAAGITVAAMESCTGGLLMSSLTKHPSSGFLLGGVVAYDEGAKAAMGVPGELLKEFGVVSAEVAESMAVEVARAFGTEVGIGITGEAGPDSATGAPVGTVFVALQTSEGRCVERIACTGGRGETRNHAVALAAGMLRSACADARGGNPSR